MSESSATASPTPSRPPSSSDPMTRRQLFATASGQLHIGPAYVPVEATPGALNVGHGHVIPRPDGVRARCGGPGLCRECSQDMARQRTEGTVDVHVSGSVARVTIAADVRKLAEALRAAAEEAALAWPPRRPAEAGAKPGAQAGRPPLVLIESPYAGDVARNERYARACLADSLARGEAPLASHLPYTQPGVLDDTNPAERRQGIEAGLAWGARATLTAVYDDLGVTEGMRQGIARAKAEGRPVVFRQLPGKVGEPFDPEPPRPTSCENCGTSYDACTDRIMRGRGAAACCRACYSTDRHAAIPWEQWRRRQQTRDAEGARPTDSEGVTP